jgi:hypothetical protein
MVPKRSSNIGKDPMNPPNDFSNNVRNPIAINLKKLTVAQVKRIDEVLVSLGDYGEVHLIVQRGELRYINRVESYKVWNSREQKQ